MEFNIGGVQIPTAWALAVVAGFAYVLGRCGRHGTTVSKARLLELKRGLQRAQLAATRLETIIGATRTNLERHQSRLKKFKRRIKRLKGQPRDDLWEKLGREVEEVLDPTIHLAAQVASAHDVMRYETSVLMTFSDLRTDPLTGVCNRRGLDHALEMQFAVMQRYGAKFSLLLVDIDNFKDVNDRKGHLHGDEVLRELARILEQEAREPDIVARYGGDEFIVVMPQTGLEGAIVMAERLRRRIEQSMSFTISGGVAAAERGDTATALFLRVDSALYAAKAAGRNCMFRHDGEAAKAVTNPLATVAAPIHETSASEAVQ